jgi:hypothetical protein
MQTSFYDKVTKSSNGIAQKVQMELHKKFKWNCTKSSNGIAQKVTM